MILYTFLNIFFLVFHSVLIVFNLFGWAWRRTRRANLFTLSCTAFSWYVLGIWYSFGYCPCTDWHWQVRRHLGYHDMPASYIKFLIDSLTGLDIDPTWANRLAVTCFLMACATSLYVNLKDRKKGA